MFSNPKNKKKNSKDKTNNSNQDKGNDEKLVEDANNASHMNNIGSHFSSARNNTPGIHSIKINKSQLYRNKELTTLSKVYNGHMEGESRITKESLSSTKKILNLRDEFKNFDLPKVDHINKNIDTKRYIMFDTGAEVSAFCNKHIFDEIIYDLNTTVDSASGNPIHVIGRGFFSIKFKSNSYKLETYYIPNIEINLVSASNKKIAAIEEAISDDLESELNQRLAIKVSDFKNEVEKLSSLNGD